MTETTADDVTDTAAGVTTFPQPRTCPFAPPPVYENLRAEQPVSKVALRGGGTAWVIASHELVRKILADPRVSSDRTLPGCPRLVKVPPQSLKPSAMPLIALDPPEHTVHRRMVVNEFTVQRVTGLRPRIQEIVDERIDALTAGERPADLVAALSVPVPSLVICELLGVPYSDRETFHRISQVIVSHDSAPPEVAAAIGELRAFLGDLVTAKERKPGEDLLSRLVVRYAESGAYDRERVISTAQILLNAGHETTANMISLGVLALLEQPEQLAQVRADPTLMPHAVEELLRFFSIGDLATFRTATADIELGGVTIPAGDGLIALNAAANRDPAVFPDPDRLDVRRSARQHVAFGFGVHQCLGQNLARAELEIVFETLFRRIPDLRLAAPVEEIPFKNDGLFYGAYRMPVTW